MRINRKNATKYGIGFITNQLSILMPDNTEAQAGKMTEEQFMREVLQQPVPYDSPEEKPVKIQDKNPDKEHKKKSQWW